MHNDSKHLIDSTLFLGLPVDSSLALSIGKINPQLLSLFLHSGEDYLQEVTFQGTRYIGKFVQNEEPLIQLELLEANIFSLLKKLIPNHPYENSHLILFALPQQKIE